MAKAAAPQSPATKTVEAGGQTYTVFFGTYAFRHLEKALGKPASELVEVLQGSLSIETMILLVQAGLARHHGDVGEVEACDVMDALGGVDGIGDLFAEAMPEPEADGPANGGKDAPGKTKAAR